MGGTREGMRKASSNLGVWWLALVGLGLGLGVGACSNDRAGNGDGLSLGGEGTDSMTGNADAGDAGDDASGDGDGDSDGDGDGDGGPKFDVADGNDSGGDSGADDGCTKVDFLFVVDNSGSMGQYQMRLTQALPEFISAIESSLELDDYHIMSVDTDAAPVDCLGLCDPSGNGTCNSASCAGLQAQMGCEAELGGGRRTDINGNACPVDGPQRYLLDTQTNLADTFECVARQGGGNGVEQQMQAMIAAVSSPLIDAGGCNEGFLRDDAVLVVTVISDESDSSMDTADDWYQELIAAKADNPDAIVFLGIFNPKNPPMKMTELAGKFQFGATISIEEPDYTPSFINLASSVTEACDTFVPPG